MEDARLEERKRTFMKGRPPRPPSPLLGPQNDLVRERENWTVHLRKKKNYERINRKRTNLLSGAALAERQAEVHNFDPALLNDSISFVRALRCAA